MEYITSTLGNLVHQTAFFSLTWGNLIMIAVACFFLYLAIARGFEPLLLVPIAESISGKSSSSVDPHKKHCPNEPALLSCH